MAMCRDLTTIMIPLLQRLYGASARTPSALYMLLIVVLILSQDVAFAKAIHGIRIPSAPWFRERLLQNTTLGDHPSQRCPSYGGGVGNHQLQRRRQIGPTVHDGHRHGLCAAC